MKGLKILLMILLGAAVSLMIVSDILAETRTLTTIIMITVRAPQTQSAQAPTGLEELYNVALSQSQNQRLIKIEEPLNTPSGLPRHTMTERL
ncbi:MAG: hypothetical protein HZA30_04895 [Candidatus Omnitrophica bacterium]|nr:hypothetical protein [Candidatus Omnitrophota bacterium]